MEQYLLSFLLKSLVISAIVPVVSGFNALFGKAFPAKLRYAIWLAILAGLMLPLPPAIGRGIITVPPVQTQYAQGENSPSDAPYTTQVVTDTTAAIPFLVRYLSPFMICVFIWGVTALAVFSRHILRYFRFLQTIRRWGVTVNDENTLSVFRAVLAEMELDEKNICLKICGFVSSSMLTGFSRPVILLPEKHFEADELRLIFRHELIHFKRLDLFVKLLSVIAVSIYWFNPLIYWMCEAMQADGEASCDEAVCRTQDKENRRFYAEVIIGMIGKNTAATILSTCFFYRGKFSIKKRLDAIMDTTRKMKWPAVIVIAAVTVLTLFSGSVFAFAVQETPAGFAQTRAAPELPLAVNAGMEIALSRTGGGIVEEIEFERENGTLVYDITVRRENQQYEVKIDALTGEIAEFREEASATALTQAYNTARISFTKAIETAVASIGGGTIEEVELEYERGILIYEVNVIYENRHYEVKVDAITGKIVF